MRPASVSNLPVRKSSSAAVLWAVVKLTQFAVFIVQAFHSSFGSAEVKAKHVLDLEGQAQNAHLPTYKVDSRPLCRRDSFVRFVFGSNRH